MRMSGFQLKLNIPHMRSPVLFKIFFLMVLQSCTIEFKNDDCKSPEINSKQEGNTYICPMDCEKGKVYNANIGCPKCKMSLININDNSSK